MTAPEPEWDEFESREVADFLADQAERDLARRCQCYDFESMEYDPAGPCPACVADEIAGAA